MATSLATPEDPVHWLQFHELLARSGQSYLYDYWNNFASFLLVIAQTNPRSVPTEFVLLVELDHRVEML